MHSTIFEAVSKQQCLQFSYNGFNRVIEPHAYGLSKKGNNIIRGYQTRGESESGNIPDWRLFEEDKMRNIHLLNESSEVRSDYKRGDKAMIRIYIEIKRLLIS